MVRPRQPLGWRALFSAFPLPLPHVPRAPRCKPRARSCNRFDLKRRRTRTRRSSSSTTVAPDTRRLRERTGLRPSSLSTPLAGAADAGALGAPFFAPLLVDRGPRDLLGPLRAAAELAFALQ